MNYIVLVCLGIIWTYSVYGFVTDNMGLGLFGRIWSAIAHGAIATLALALLGGLCFVTVLVFKEIV